MFLLATAAAVVSFATKEVVGGKGGMVIPVSCSSSGSGLVNDGAGSNIENSVVIFVCSGTRGSGNVHNDTGDDTKKSRVVLGGKHRSSAGLGHGVAVGSVESYVVFPTHAAPRD